MERIRLPLVSVRWYYGAALTTLPAQGQKSQGSGETQAVDLEWGQPPATFPDMLEIGLPGIAPDIWIVVALGAGAGVGHAASLAAIALAWLVAID